LITSPRILLRLEGLAVLIAACVLYHEAGYPWGRFFMLFLLPDVLMAGYLFGTGIGASIYNAGHTYAAPILLLLLSILAHLPSLLPLALIWTSHIAFDRLLGYGLKYATAFKDTHLGRV
jgi:hypothetical protein